MDGRYLALDFTGPATYPQVIWTLPQMGLGLLPTKRKRTSQTNLVGAAYYNCHTREARAMYGISSTRSTWLLRFSVAMQSVYWTLWIGSRTITISTSLIITWDLSFPNQVLHKPSIPIGLPSVPNWQSAKKISLYYISIVLLTVQIANLWEIILVGFAPRLASLPVLLSTRIFIICYDNPWN